MRKYLVDIEQVVDMGLVGYDTIAFLERMGSVWYAFLWCMEYLSKDNSTHGLR
jgi:hypothetical protein